MKPVLAYHATFAAYGFWLPNDPRGSWSEFVGSWDLFRHGRATKTDDPRSLAKAPHDRADRLAAKHDLKRPPVSFNGVQARAVGRGFAEYVRRSGLTVWACSILPEHVHLVIARFRISIESIVIQLIAASTTQLFNEGLHPFQNDKERNGKTPKCFVRGEWSVFLDTGEAIRRSIEYVEENPVKEGKPKQVWNFVTPYHPNDIA